MRQNACCFHFSFLAAATADAAPCCIIFSLEYLPFYWKLSNHIWQLYTLSAGKFFPILKFDLYLGHMIKKILGWYTRLSSPLSKIY